MDRFREIEVRTGNQGPMAFSVDGLRFRVKEIVETWCVMITSSKPQREVQRTYYDVLTHGGQRAYLVHDHRNKRWGLEKPE